MTKCPSIWTYHTLGAKGGLQHTMQIPFPEGAVVRSPDRARVVKIRREDYKRSLKRRNKQQERQVQS
jgi:hypothetical protein